MRKLAVLLCLLLSLLAPEPARAQFADQATWGGTAGGTANAITVTVNNLSRHTAGVKITFLAQLANTTAATFKPNPALTAIAMRLPSAQGPVALAGGEIQIGNMVTVAYDGTFYQILSVTKINGVRTVTAAPTVTTADCGGLIVLGGSGFYNVTVGSPGSFPSGCSIQFYNSNNSRGRGFSPSGSTTCRLFPLHRVQIVNSGSAWGGDPACSRWQPNSSPTLQVNETFGSDDPAVADCLGTGAGACRTFNGAVDVASKYIEVGGGGVTIQSGCEAQYNQTVVVHDKQPLSFSFVGNPGSPSTCIINPLAGGTAFDIEDSPLVTVNGFLVIFSNNNGNSILFARQFAILDFANMVFGSVNGSHVSAADHGSINAVGNYTIAGNANAHMSATGGSHIAIGGNTVSYQSNPSLAGGAGAVYVVVTGSQIESEGGATTWGSIGGSTISGIKYNVGSCAFLSLGGSVLPSSLGPGSGPGTCSAVTP